MTLRDAIELFRRFSENADERRRFLEDTQQALDQIGQALQFVVPATVQVARIAVPVMGAAARKWLENAARITSCFRDVTSYRKVMIQLGWPPVFHLEPNQLEELGKIINDDSISASEVATKLERRLLAWHDDEALDDLINAWSEHSLVNDNVAAILRDAVQAHQDGKYTLSVPAILPQIEGLIARGFGHEGQMYGGTLKDYVGRLLGLSISGSIAKRFLNDSYLARFEHGDEIDTPLSRHAVLHGGDVQYATAAVSLRAILFFDYLLTQMSFVASEEGQTLHVIRGCDDADAIPSEQRTFFVAANSGNSAGYDNCPHCFAT